MFGKIQKINNNSVLILPRSKTKTVRKSGNQILKIDEKVVNFTSPRMLDAFGNELNVGDCVISNGATESNTWYTKSYTGKMLFGTVVSFSSASIEILFDHKKTTNRKYSHQVIKISNEQLVLRKLTY